MLVHNFNIGSLPLRNAKLYANSKALIMDDRFVTFKEFNHRVNQLANALKSIGIAKGTRIATLLPNSFELAEVYFAAAKLGAIVVPINLRILPQDVTFILSDSGAKVVFADSDTLTLLEPEARNLMENIIITTENNPELNLVDYHSLLSVSTKDEPVNQYDINSKDTLMICYTSGTTGKPKGCMISHGAFLASNYNITMRCGIEASDCWLNALPFYHVGDLGFFFAYFQMGATNVLLKKTEIPLIVENIKRHHCTSTLIAPPLTTEIINFQKQSPFEISSLKFIVAPAALDSMEVIRGITDILKCDFLGIYAQSEAGDVISSIGLEEQLERPTSCGKPVANFEWKLVDEDDNEVNLGEKGELVLRGPSIMQGYWNNNAATEETFKNGWHHTGDICREDEDGYLYMVDRKKYLIKPGGLNVYPKEVESCLREHPAIQEAAVVGVPDSNWGEAVKAFVVLKPGNTLTPKDVYDWCTGRIANFKRPSWVEFIEAIPYNFTGKLLKDDLVNRPLSPEHSTKVLSN